MKKILLLILVAIFSVSLASCRDNESSSIVSSSSSNESSSSSNESSSSNKESSNSSKESSNSSKESSSSTEESSGSTGLPISDTHYIKGGYEYFIVENSSADVLRMRVPYIENAVPDYSKDFYSSCEGKSGSSLKGILEGLTSTVHQEYNWSRFYKIDEDPNNTNNIWTIYGATSLPKDAHVSGNAANKWNREHTFPQSKFGKANPMVGDSNHIFADDWKTNGIRSNKKYGDLANTSGNQVLDSANSITANYSNGSYFEPMDAVKGQVARATLYMATRYAQSNGVRLKVTDNFSSLALCLRWNDEFPPTSWEITRNNKVYKEQGNRNPFTDHPEYARLIFGNN